MLQHFQHLSVIEQPHHYPRPVQHNIGLAKAQRGVTGFGRSHLWRLKVDEVNREVCFKLRDSVSQLICSCTGGYHITGTAQRTRINRTSGTPASSLPVPPIATILASSTATVQSLLPELKMDKPQVSQSASGIAAANTKSTSVLALAVSWHP